MSLKSWAADEVMPLPVFMLAEGAAVASGVAAAARLASFTATIPATLRKKRATTVSFHRNVRLRNEVSNVHICAFICLSLFQHKSRNKL